MALRHYDFGKLSFVNIVGYYCSLVVGLILRLCFVYCLGCFCCLLVLMRGFCGLLVFGDCALCVCFPVEVFGLPV